MSLLWLPVRELEGKANHRRLAGEAHAAPPQPEGVGLGENEEGAHSTARPSRAVTRSISLSFPPHPRLALWVFLEVIS